MTNPVFLTSELVEVYTTTWVDITSYVIKDIDSEWGIDGQDLTDRVAGEGEISITLNNASGLFTPGGPSVLSGFDKGIYLKYTLTYDEKTFVKFYGRIEDIEPTGGRWENNEVKITALDWIDSLSKFKMEGFQLFTNQRAEQGIQLVIVEMPVAPLGTDYATGNDTFPTIFDTVKDGTRGLSEVTKFVLSEMGWAYLRKDKANGELFVFESRTTRDSKDRTLAPVSKVSSDFLATEGGDYLMTEGGDYIILNQLAAFSFDDNMISARTNYGANMINDLSMVSYPRRVDTSVQVLYEVSERIPLIAGATKSNLKVTYKDPSGGDIKVNANPATMVTPVATTDYTMFSNSDGTGTNLTANLTLTQSFAVEGVTFSIQNTGGTDGYVWLRFRGYGIYTKDPITYRTTDNTSITTYDTQAISVQQYYQNDPTISEGIANFALASRSLPLQTLESIDFIANISESFMSAFLYFDIGDKVYVKVTKRNIDGDYFIQKIKYKIKAGGLIQVTYSFTDALSVGGSPWLLGIEGRSELGQTTIVGF